MNVLISGGAGFAGSGLTLQLLKKGYDVTVLDIVGPLQSDKLRPYLDQITYKWKAVQDITEEDVKGQNVIIHLQAQADVPMGITSPQWTTYNNILGITSVLETCRKADKLEKFIYAGSGNEWGRPLYLPIDEKHPLTPHNPYAFSKAACELACWAWKRCYNIPIIVMSNGAVAGPGMRKDIFIFKWLYNILQGKPVVLEGGDQTRDLTYVSDVIDAWLLTIEAPKEEVVGEKFQVSYGKEVSVKELLLICMNICQKNVNIIHKGYRPGEEGQREFFDNSKARRILGYRPKVPPEEAIRLTKEWIEKEVL